jgi:hypothetical protein
VELELLILEVVVVVALEALDLVATVVLVL